MLDFKSLDEISKVIDQGRSDRHCTAGLIGGSQRSDRLCMAGLTGQTGWSDQHCVAGLTDPRQEAGGHVTID